MVIKCKQEEIWCFSAI